MRKIGENSVLISELNGLRVNNKQLKDKVRILESEMRDMQKIEDQVKPTHTAPLGVGQSPAPNTNTDTLKNIAGNSMPGVMANLEGPRSVKVEVVHLPSVTTSN